MKRDKDWVWVPMVKTLINKSLLLSRYQNLSESATCLKEARNIVEKKNLNKSFERLILLRENEIFAKALRFEDAKKSLAELNKRTKECFKKHHPDNGKILRC